MTARAWLAKTVGGIHIPTKPQLSIALAEALTERLKPGTIVLSYNRLHLTNILIPGFYNHAALVLPYQQIIDATNDGVQVHSLHYWLRQRDHVAVVVPFGMAYIDNLKFCEAALSQTGKPYDYAFEYKQTNNRAFYCAELVYWALKQAKPGFDLELRERLGLMTIVPDDFYRARTKFVVKFDSAK